MAFALGLNLVLYLELLLFSLLLAACGGLLILQLGLMRVFRAAPALQVASEGVLPETSLCIVIPAYNEVHNIGPCLSSVLGSEPPCRAWHVLTCRPLVNESRPGRRAPVCRPSGH